MGITRRAIATGALALPLTLGTAGIASADTFSSTDTHAGPNGASSEQVNASTDGQGGSSYNASQTTAGPDGATSDSVNSNSDADGSTSYNQNSNSAGPNGASSSSTSASTDGENAAQNSGLLGVGILGL